MATRTMTMIMQKQEPVKVVHFQKGNPSGGPPDEDGGGEDNDNRSKKIDCHIISVIGIAKIIGTRKLEGDNLYAIRTNPPPEKILESAPIGSNAKKQQKHLLIKNDKTGKYEAYIHQNKRPSKNSMVYLVRCDNIKNEAESIIWTTQIKKTNHLVKEYKFATGLKKSPKAKGNIKGDEIVYRRIKTTSNLIQRLDRAITNKNLNEAKTILSTLCRFKIMHQFNRDAFNRFARRKFKISNAENMDFHELCHTVMTRLNI